MGGRQPFIKRFGTGDEESFKDLFKNHFVEGLTGITLNRTILCYVNRREKERGTIDRESHISYTRPDTPFFVNLFFD